MTIKALVLDLDGTLYSHRKELLADKITQGLADRYLIKSRILKKIPKWRIKHLYKLIEQGYTLTVSKILSEEYGLDKADFEEYVFDVYPEDVGIKRDPVLINLISKLSKEYKIILFTNAKKIWYKRTLKRIGIEKLMPERIILSPESMRGYVKPEPETFDTLIKRFKLDKKETLFLDDKEFNIMESRKVGIKAILVNNDVKDKSHSIHALLKGIAYNKKAPNITKL